MPAEELATRYARSGDAHIAYQVIGGGPAMVLVPGLTSHLELQWEDTAYRSFVRRLARFSTVIRYDKRGTGLSDPVSSAPTLEERVDDLAAVIAEVGVARPVLAGVSEGGPIAIRFAAEHKSVAGLVLYGTSARPPPPWFVEKAGPAIAAWGSGASLDLFAPSLADDHSARATRARLERGSASPAMIREIVAASALIDVRPLLSLVHAPALVLHRDDDVIPLEEAHYLADHLPNARLVQLPGIDHMPWVGDAQPIVDEIERFLADVSPAWDRRGERLPRPRARVERPVTGWASLTTREQAVAALVGDGWSNPAIATRLYISRQTVETHVKHIFAKLGIDSRAALAATARRHAGQPNT
jgi:pimeloyl-ACP methyl ester carboxylesterase/DNA-binding CsgD family transcriptional regulator